VWWNTDQAGRCGRSRPAERDEARHCQRHGVDTLDPAVGAVDIGPQTPFKVRALQYTGKRMPSRPVHDMVAGHRPRDDGEHDPAEAQGFGSGERSGRHHEGVGRHRREQRVERDQPGEHECAQQWSRRQRREVHAVSVDAARSTFNGLRRKSG